MLKVDDPAWDTMFLPNGWGCKCRVRQLSEREANDLGGESTAPSAEDIAAGIDPEWSYNPGEAPRRG